MPAGPRTSPPWNLPGSPVRFYSTFSQSSPSLIPLGASASPSIFQPGTFLRLSSCASRSPLTSPIPTRTGSADPDRVAIKNAFAASRHCVMLLKKRLQASSGWSHSSFGASSNPRRPYVTPPNALYHPFFGLFDDKM